MRGQPGPDNPITFAKLCGLKRVATNLPHRLTPQATLRSYDTHYGLERMSTVKGEKL